MIDNIHKNVVRELHDTTSLGALTLPKTSKPDTVTALSYEQTKDSPGKPINIDLVMANLNLFGCLLGLISLFIGGFSWWVVGLLLATIWSFGAMKIATQKYRQHLVSSGEMIAQMIILGLSLSGLVIVSVVNAV